MRKMYGIMSRKSNQNGIKLLGEIILAFHKEKSTVAFSIGQLNLKKDFSIFFTKQGDVFLLEDFTY